MNKETILAEIIKVYEETKVPPSVNDPRIEKIMYYIIKEFGSWSSVLKYLKLKSLSEWKTENSLEKYILLYLTDKFATKKEILKYLYQEQIIKNDKNNARVNIFLGNSSLIKKIKINNYKIYFLEGNELLVEKKFQIYNNSHLYDELLEYLNEPRDYSDIRIKYKHKNIKKILDDLVEENLINRIKFKIGGNPGSRKYNPNELFGDLAYKTFYYKLINETETAKFIIKKIPEHKDSNLARARNYHMKRILPHDIYEYVKIYL